MEIKIIMIIRKPINQNTIEHFIFFLGTIKKNKDLRSLLSCEYYIATFLYLMSRQIMNGLI